MNKTWWWVAAFIVVGILLGTGIIYLVSRPPVGQPVILLPAPTPAPIMIYVHGGVNRAGVYSLPVHSRINDAIQAAGGFSEFADTESINLAELLVDGEDVNVPILPVLATDVGEYGQSTASPSNAATASPMIVNINTATLDELDTLPEIGPKTAQAIIDYRNMNGYFTKIEDLINVYGIGQATIEKIRDLVTVGNIP